MGWRFHCSGGEDFKSTLAESEMEAPNGGKQARASVCWADLVDTDSEDEVQNRTAHQFASRTRATRWADLVDGDEEQIILGCSREVSGNTEVQSATHECPTSQTHDLTFVATSNTCLRSERCPSMARPQQFENIESSGERQTVRKKRQRGRNTRTHDEPHRAGAGVATSMDCHQELNRNATEGRRQNSALVVGQNFAGNRSVNSLGKESNGKLQCQFVVGIEEDSKFRVVRRLLGIGGMNMKTIASETGAKLRLRGRGSKFLEGRAQQESTDDLMLCISCQDSSGFEMAQERVTEILQGIYESYYSYCRKEGKRPPNLAVQLHEGYRKGSR